MSVYVFLGPTASAELAAAELDATYLPPAAQGDVYRVALRRPRAIGIVDGYFSQVPAIWHKEILWALQQGVHVYGASSMGALRAAELAPFGMVGVGSIFEAFRDGTLEDDDEVALMHAPADSGYRPISEPMVNIRASLQRAEIEAVIGASTRAALETIAKELFYPERRYAEILQRGHTQDLDRAELAALRDWLPVNRVDQKLADARAMLRRMRDDLSGDIAPKKVDYVLAQTSFWHEFAQLAGGLDKGDTMLSSDAIVDELRLEGVATYRHAKDTALVRSLALRVADQQGYRVDEETLRRYASAFRESLGIARTDQELDEWTKQNQLDSSGFDTLVKEDALIRRVAADQPTRTRGQLLTGLRLTGRYIALRRRAVDKRTRLEACGLWSAPLEAAGITSEELLGWYFDRSGPFASPSVRQHVNALEFDDEDALIEAARREYCYQRLLEGRKMTATLTKGF